jgi:putative ABC transport system permease protein
LHAIWGDCRLALRLLLREPALAASVILTLGIGVGIATAIFSALDAVVLRPLPYGDPDRLVAVWQTDRTDGSRFVASPGDFRDWRREQGVFAALGAVQQFRDVDFNLSIGASPEHVRGIRFTPDVFDVLGVPPQLGRAFTPADVDAQRSVALLAHDLWVTRFGGDLAIVGREVVVNGAAVTVIGVMPRGFEIPLVRAQLFLPLLWTPAQQEMRRDLGCLILGRLQPGMSIAAAQTRMDEVARTLERVYPADNKDTGVAIDPLQDVVVGMIRPTLVILFAAAACVLALACFNLANLMAARAIARQRELAIRAALGASRARLVGAALVEAMTLASAGTITGVAFGAWALRAFIAVFNDTAFFSLPRRAEIGLDWRAFLFAAAVCVIAAAVCAAAPAVSVAAHDLVAALKRPHARPASRVRAVLVAAELAVALALVVATSLLVRSYARLHETPVGFATDRTLAATVALPPATYAAPATRVAFFERLVAEARALPEVESAGAVRFLPLSGVASIRPVRVPGRTDRLPDAFHHAVTAGYFETMRIPVFAGRPFTDADADARRVVLGEAAARRYFPNQSPIGRTIVIDDEAHAAWEVIGVVGDVRNQRVDRVPRPQLYVPLSRTAPAAMTLVVRTSGDPLQVAGAVRAAVRRIDPAQSVADMRPVAAIVSDGAARWRVSTLLFLGFAAAAVMLAVVGLHGVTAYAVAQRTREIAVRIALGGTARSVVLLIARSMSAVAAAGLAAGAALAVALTRGIASLLYDTNPLDPAAIGVAALGFLLIVTATAILSAARAAAVEPAAALRAE